MDYGQRIAYRGLRIAICGLWIADRGLKIVYPDLCIVNYRSCFVDSGSRLDHELKTMQREIKDRGLRIADCRPRITTFESPSKIENCGQWITDHGSRIANQGSWNVRRARKENHGNNMIYTNASNLPHGRTGQVVVSTPTLPRGVF